MGCDIHCYAERKTDDGKWEAILKLAPFSNQGYSTYSFLAGVRNTFGITPIKRPQGLPSDASDEVIEAYREWCGEAHTASYLSMSELEEFNYYVLIEKQLTYHDFLGELFFNDLKALRSAGAERIIFWFDN